MQCDRRHKAVLLADRLTEMRAFLCTFYPRKRTFPLIIANPIALQPGGTEGQQKVSVMSGLDNQPEGQS
jgi:hypothetical protein